MRFRALLSLDGIAGPGNDFDFHLFTSPGFKQSADSGRRVHFQSGKGFGERLENALETLAGLGYSEVVVVGRDCPELSRDLIGEAFRLLDRHRLVLGPDHRGGCYLIGLRCRDRALLAGIRWRKNTDCRQLEQRCASAQCARLPVKRDLDGWADLHVLASVKGWGVFLEAFFSGPPTGLSRPRPPILLKRLHQAIRWQLPPPLWIPLPQ